MPLRDCLRDALLVDARREAFVSQMFVVAQSGGTKSPGFIPLATAFHPLRTLAEKGHSRQAMAWLILLIVLSPLLVFVGWVVIRQLRGGFDGPEPERTEPPFFQRHVWLAGGLFCAFIGYRVGGPSGIFFGPLAGAILFAVLAPLGALMATLISLSEHPGSGEEKCSSKLGPASSAAEAVDDRFHRRFLRNLRRAVREPWG